LRRHKDAKQDDRATTTIMAKDKSGSDTFERQTFSVSRDAEFASIQELEKQTGHPVADWLLVVVKESIDNARGPWLSRAAKPPALPRGAAPHRRAA
jgi:hypothetical protein